ncbi:MAG TPA: four helix bundle protein [Acidobacteriaceae bacterium]|nr:four helix bundle protein [Acidobacteriaceae bacterium]
MGKSFYDLTVWQRSIEMTTLIYQMTTEFPRSEIYGLTSQMRRAAVSVASNIAEGTGRGSKAEFRQFLNIARGSNCELQTQLVIASNLRMVTRDRIETATSLSYEVGRMLNGLLASIAPSGR